METLLLNNTAKPRIITGADLKSGSVLRYKLAKKSTAVLVLPIRGNTDLTIAVMLDQPGSNITVIGLIYAKGTEHIKIKSLVHHQAPQTTSNFIFRSVLSDSAEITVMGTIKIESDAIGSDAKLRTNNLLLSDQAQTILRPVMEIKCDQVKAVHGATSGQIADSEINYLTARGIGESQAKAMIARGFLTAAISSYFNSKTKDDIIEKLTAL